MRVVLPSFALAAVGAQTSWTATWHSSQSGTGRPMSIWGYTPAAASDETFQVPANETTTATTHPLYVWVTGTNEIFNGPADKDNAIEMAKKGFVGAIVQYDNSDYPVTCKDFEARAQPIFSQKWSAGALTVLCKRADVDCDKGIVVHGFSQVCWFHIQFLRTCYHTNNTVVVTVLSHTGLAAGISGTLVRAAHQGGTPAGARQRGAGQPEHLFLHELRQVCVCVCVRER
jgi:hypothetical protein